MGTSKSAVNNNTGSSSNPLDPVNGDPIVQEAIFKKNISTAAKKKIKQSKVK